VPAAAGAHHLALYSSELATIKEKSSMKYHALSRRFAIDPGGGARQTKGTHMRKGFWRKQKVVSTVCAGIARAYDNTRCVHEYVCAEEKVGERARENPGLRCESTQDESCTRRGCQSVSDFLSPCCESSPRLPFSE
jgi:hypothetical protein